MNTSNLLRATLILILPTMAWAVGSAKRQPNILLVFADDLGWAQAGFNGSRYYATPHLDRLATEGVRFTQAYAASPVCSPTRGALMTGLHPARTHITDFIPGNPYPWARLRQPEWQKFLPLERETVAELLSAHGYVTGLVGKWHLAAGYFPPESVEHGPDRQGFSETFVTHKPEPEDDPENDAHNTEKITRRSLQFIEEHRDQPFFLEIAYNAIHAPVMEGKALVEKYRTKPGSDLPENNPVIGAMIEVLDGSVGRILAELDRLGLQDNTVVIFYSDNGGLVRSAPQTPLRGGKAQLYEGGIRVPLLVRWPGVVAPGRTELTTVTTVDFLPTFLEIAQATLPSTFQPDGVSLVSLLSGAGRLDRPALFWHYPHYHPAGVGPAGAVRSGDWKLIENFEYTITGRGRPPELFDLGADPYETKDLASVHPDKVAELLGMLREWRHSVGAQMPVENPVFDAKREDLLADEVTAAVK